MAVVPQKSRMTRMNGVTMVIVYAVESLAELAEWMKLISDKLKVILRSGYFPWSDSVLSTRLGVLHLLSYISVSSLQALQDNNETYEYR